MSKKHIRAAYIADAAINIEAILRDLIEHIERDGFGLYEVRGSSIKAGIVEELAVAACSTAVERVTWGAANRNYGDLHTKAMIYLNSLLSVPAPVVIKSVCEVLDINTEQPSDEFIRERLRAVDDRHIAVVADALAKLAGLNNIVSDMLDYSPEDMMLDLPIFKTILASFEHSKLAQGLLKEIEALPPVPSADELRDLFVRISRAIVRLAR